MKKTLPIFILIFAFSAFGQKVNQKPAPKSKVPSIIKETKLETLRKLKRDATEEREKLLTYYTEDYPKIKQLNAQITEIDEQIRNLIASDPSRNLKVDDLPSDSIFLLKILIIQNQRIIELLEKAEN